MAITDKIIQQVTTNLGRSLKSGERLIYSYGLQEFSYIWIQKVINLSLDVFIITVDSRFPSHYISRSKLDRLQANDFMFLQQRGLSFSFKEFKLTPAIDLWEFRGDLGSNDIVVFRDLAGEYYMNKSLYQKKR